MVKNSVFNKSEKVEPPAWQEGCYSASDIFVHPCALVENVLQKQLVSYQLL